jgi:hypothetical protein
MKRSLQITFATLLVSLSVFAQQETQPPNSEPLRVIDVHTHTSFSDKPDSNRSQARYFEEWKLAGVVGAVAHTSANGGGVFPLKDRNVIYCAGLGEQSNVKTIEAGLRSGKFGCLKVYLGYVHRYAYDQRYEPFYRLAQKYDVPVVFHTGDTNSKVAKLKYADPLTIDEVAVDHPKVRFVIAHCGNPWIESAAEVAYKNPNVFLECSAMLIGNLEEMSKEKVDEFMVKPIAWIFGYVEDPGKLMFGTDWPLTGIKPYLDAYKRAIPKEHWNAVFHDNAVRVFKFPPKP